MPGMPVGLGVSALYSIQLKPHTPPPTKKIEHHAHRSGQEKKVSSYIKLNNLSFYLFFFLRSKNLFSKYPTTGINIIIVLCIWFYLFMLMAIFHGVNRLDPHIPGTSLLYLIHRLHPCSRRHIFMLMGLRCDIIHNLLLEAY